MRVRATVLRMPADDPLLAALAGDLRRLTRTLEVEVAIAVPVRRGRPEPLVVVAVGSCDRVGLDVGQALRPVLTSGADGLVLAHNHPARQLVSREDRAFTRRLVAAGAVVGVAVRGHLVLLDHGWVDCLRDGEELWPYETDRAA